MELLSIISVVCCVLPVYHGVQGLSSLGGLVVLRDSFTGFSKSKLHPRVGGTVLNRLEEEGVVPEHVHHLLHEDVLLRVFTSLRLDAKEFVFDLSGLINQNGGTDIRISTPPTLGVQLPYAAWVRLTRSQM